jgi:hypothetical protein
MSTVAGTGEFVDAGLGLLDRERIIAKAGFNRWLVPPAALCIHLCIGMAYGFSVFWLPLSRALGVTAAKTCPDISLVQELFTTPADPQFRGGEGPIFKRRLRSVARGSRELMGQTGRA